jgi:hypothetical protein
VLPAELLAAVLAADWPRVIEVRGRMIAAREGAEGA